MQESALAVLTEPETSIEIATDEPVALINDVIDLNDLIASRAFEIFEDSGKTAGHDLADWLQAEAEFIHPLHIEVSESPEALTIRADVPGFTEKDLKINVEPRRVTITGKREGKSTSKTGKVVYSETCSNQILRAVDLPAAVDVNDVKTSVKDGVLELELSKAGSSKSTDIEW
jgi:HSP20 family protein